MADTRITPLDPQRQAETILRLQQDSYREEARLLGLDDFPPLRRTLEEVRTARTFFLGFWYGAELAALLEYAEEAEGLEITSLVVHPSLFRRGLASQLLTHLLKAATSRRIRVHTAAANRPALRLYQNHGFRLEKEWTTRDGVDMVSLVLPRES